MPSTFLALYATVRATCCCYLVGSGEAFGGVWQGSGLGSGVATYGAAARRASRQIFRTLASDGWTTALAAAVTLVGVLCLAAYCLPFCSRRSLVGAVTPSAYALRGNTALALPVIASPLSAAAACGYQQTVLRQRNISAATDCLRAVLYRDSRIRRVIAALGFIGDMFDVALFAARGA
jgi:hypothetical protein